MIQSPELNLIELLWWDLGRAENKWTTPTLMNWNNVIKKSEPQSLHNNLREW